MSSKSGFQRELLILRHAKSAWDTDAPGDFDRPLAKRGRKDAPRMGRWMRKHDLVPDYVVSSPALRARETTAALVDELEIAENAVHFDERVYLGSALTLLQVLADVPNRARSVLLVGHNPGLEELLDHLCENELVTTDDGKLLTTAGLARIGLSLGWDHLARHSGRLLALVRPREIKK
jgi:phosphohistidine phosphatase